METFYHFPKNIWMERTQWTVTVTGIAGHLNPAYICAFPFLVRVIWIKFGLPPSPSLFFAWPLKLWYPLVLIIWLWLGINTGSEHGHRLVGITAQLPLNAFGLSMELNINIVKGLSGSCAPRLLNNFFFCKVYLISFCLSNIYQVPIMC